MIAIVFMTIGIICIILSFFIGKPSSQIDLKFEQLSIQLFEQQNEMKQRLKTIEDELLIVTPRASYQKNVQIEKPQATNGPVHAIIVNQILSLHQQGYALPEISKRSNVSQVEILRILKEAGQ